MSWKPNSPTYMLRTCNTDYTAYNWFQWPELVGFAETPIYVKPETWNPEPKCGNGLHGYVEGKGSGNQLRLDGLWQIVEVEKSEIVMIDDKAKVPQCNLIFCGSRKDATDFLVKQHYSHPILGAFVTVGDNEIANVGSYGTATAGYQGKATAGSLGTATAGYQGKAKAGIGGIIQIRYLNQRSRIKTGYIGEDGLLPNVFYKLNEKFEFIVVEHAL